MRALLASSLLTLLAVGPAVAGELPVALGDRETVVFYGDSITEQNLYSAYLETFLLGRLPSREIATFNFGWGGDTARGGAARFARDVAPVEPTLVFVNFGMNDGGYRAHDPSILAAYLETQAALADAVAAAGARQVLFTTSPVDPDRRSGLAAYNDTLGRMAEGLERLAAGRGIPSIDLFRPMLRVQREAKAADPEFTMIPDAVHPDAVGHLVMAYYALQGIDVPRSLGEIAIAGNAVSGDGGLAVGRAERSGGGLGFEVELPFIPFYVPPEARPALELVPFQRDLNRFVLRASLDGDAGRAWALAVDGAALGHYTSEQLTAGVDLALADAAPWCAAGRRLWEAAQYRWEKHREAWRSFGLQATPTMMPGLDTFAGFAAAQRAHADAMGRELATLAKPGRYRLELFPLGEALELPGVELSPTYDFDADFDRPHPPETDPDAVAWARAPLEDGRIDLGARYEAPANVVAYARVRLEASDACSLHLSLGSDDGLAVFADRKRVFANDTYRGLRPGQDEVIVPLSAGAHELLFKVTQGGGDFGLSVSARVFGSAEVRQLD
jgi:lysophospholipase L1-like esterase